MPGLLRVRVCERSDISRGTPMEARYSPGYKPAGRPRVLSQAVLPPLCPSASTYHTQPLQCPPGQHSLVPMCQPPGSSQPPRAWCSGQEALTLYQSAGFKFHLRDRWRQCPHPGAHGPRGLLAEPCTPRCQTGSGEERSSSSLPPPHGSPAERLDLKGGCGVQGSGQEGPQRGLAGGTSRK